MRRAALLVAMVILLAGCATPFGNPPSATDAPAAGTATPGDGAVPGGEETNITHTERQDPETDRLGWENGYWYDDPVAIDTSDGLNESERETVISRAMARVEYIRGLEFEESVNISVVSRSNYTMPGSGSSDTDEAFQRFDNAKFEALFVIGNSENSLQTQSDTRNQTIGGFYSPQRGDIVLVSESATPQLEGPETLAHELTHALQDQHLNLRGNAETRDAYNGRNGLIEGDASTVENEYMDRCGSSWACLSGSGEQAGSGDDSEDSDGPSINLGVYILEYFPYSDGTALIDHLRSEGGWDAVNAAFEEPPTSSTAAIHPDRYGSFEPETVRLSDRTANGWERVRPPDRADYATLGQSGLTAMFAYTLYDDYNDDAVVAPQEFLNLDAGSVNETDPFNYGLPATNGWTGDRMHVYERGDETAYVWRIAWESADEAATFADQYRSLLRHWGGERTSGNTWTIPEDSPFTDAVSLRVDGDTVTIVNAPSQADLNDVHQP
jgi:hypothetical protein